MLILIYFDILIIEEILRMCSLASQVALQQADYAGWNLWAAINERPLLPFRLSTWIIHSDVCSVPIIALASLDVILPEYLTSILQFRRPCQMWIVVIILNLHLDRMVYRFSTALTIERNAWPFQWHVALIFARRDMENWRARTPWQPWMIGIWGALLLLLLRAAKIGSIVSAVTPFFPAG